MRNDFLQVETVKLLDTEKSQRTSRRVLEWLSGESISPLPNACLLESNSIYYIPKTKNIANSLSTIMTEKRPYNNCKN